MPHVEPEMREMLEGLEQRHYKNHNFLTDEEAIEDEDTRQNNRNTITSQIINSRQRIDRRIQNREPETYMAWTTSPKRYYVVCEDYERILKSLLAICPGCSSIVEEISYAARQTEYGIAYIDIINGTRDYESTDTETDEYTYTCTNCDREIKPNNISFYFPEDLLNETIRYLRDDIARDTEQEVPPPIPTEIGFRKATQKKTTQNFFPPGRQIQKDIKAHGPSGPQMREGNGKIKMSTTEDFAFRNTNMWKCKHCETENDGSKKKCTNKNCQKDKFEPIKKITLT